MVSVWRARENIWFHGVLISWTDNITVVIKKTQQRLHFLREAQAGLQSATDRLPPVHQEPADVQHHSMVW